MPPTVPENERDSSSTEVSCTRRLDDVKEPVGTSDSTVNVIPSMLDLFSKQLVKRKKMNTEENNNAKASGPQYEVTMELDQNTAVEFNKENHNPQIDQDQIEENPEKKKKVKGIKEMSHLKYQVKKIPNIIERCEYCRQELAEIKIYQGHPNNAMEEYIALTDDKLPLYADVMDQRPQNKLTYFSVYDKNGHLCPFDTGLIEKDVPLYFSGYMKAIDEEDPLPEGGVPTKDMGPINAWYTTGYDGGELALIIFETDFGDYILVEPSEAYASFMNTVKEKIYMSKLVIEFLLDEISPAYEDLVNKLQTVVPPKDMMTFTEDTLLRHAQFICDQVSSFDDSADVDDDLLITTPCMRSLAKLAGVTLGKRAPVRQTNFQQKVKQLKKPAWTMATTTKLVNNMFENFFTDQLAKHDKTPTGPKRTRCAICEICQQPDCGECSPCRNMRKFGGNGRSKQACIRRRCPNMAIQEADDSDPENEQYEDLTEDEKVEKKLKRDFKEVRNNIVWEEEEYKVVDGQRIYYKSVMVGNERIQINDYVLVQPRNPAIPLHIYKVMFMWENKNGMKQFHGNWLCRGNETILGETSDSIELFLSDDCDDIPFTSVKSKATVIHKKMAEKWSELGNMDIDDEIKNIDGKTFFYQMRYTPETARFEDPLPDPECSRKENFHRFCPVCTRRTALEQYNIPKVFERIAEKSSKEVIYGVVKYKGEEYRVGSAVFLYPSAFKFKRILTYNEVQKPKKEVDEDIYTDFYRKGSDPKSRFSNVDISEPFHIGYINAIYASTIDPIVSSSDIYIKVNKMYRPENTHRDLTLMQQADLNMIYWSDEVCSVKFSEVAGKCYLAYYENLNESVEEWSMGGPNRFYFLEAYNVKEKTFEEPPYNIINISKSRKGNGKSKSKAKTVNETENKPVIDKPIDYSIVTRKLRTLDIFAGCGGLSEGLRQAGVAESLWAIEKVESAAYAYRLNNPKATVFSDDCNTLLRKVMDGDCINDKGQKLPQKGEVELLCGGPPCQGFSGMNRFNFRQYSLFKNSLVVSSLSYCDYYRPKFFVMENVRNFVFYKRCMVLKLTLRCLIRMGYQCTFGVLQAGNYGVPQTRRRMIILAAAPGEILPKYPEPTHVFSRRCCAVIAVVDNKRYASNCVWTKSAPFRTITVKDAMCDLPDIKNGCCREEMPYGSEPLTYFQRKMRGKQYESILRDHICKEMAPLIEARMSYIPTATGSDWRDLPNIVVRLSDGTYSKKLEYPYHDRRAGKSSTGALRGVCRCCNGEPCDPTDKQFGTLIPWCLPHTGNRHNHWSGLYGRIEWDGFFGTTITNPEPLGKQGRVLHPTQNRLVSVRECARSQGFPDSFRFYGTILDKHRQIGNAVPPPLAAAIGHEIRKCIRNTPVSSDAGLDLTNSCAEIMTRSKNVNENEEVVMNDVPDGSANNDIASTSCKKSKNVTRRRRRHLSMKN